MQVKRDKGCPGPLDTGEATHVVVECRSQVDDGIVSDATAGAGGRRCPGYPVPVIEMSLHTRMQRIPCPLATSIGKSVSAAASSRETGYRESAVGSRIEKSDIAICSRLPNIRDLIEASAASLDFRLR